MSKLDKLQISGIRAFDNGHAENIKFYTPLTLIVGYNGSGKTTIIECLKYASCGELPPNTAKGQAFVHDPSLCGEKSVLAQVRLSFHNISGAEMTCTRSMQLDVKKSARTVKTLDGSLVYKRNAERTAFSGKVAHLNKLVPEYLGVSKAILDNVIFCHQEDSLWPVSDSSTLKKRFDEIFAAQRYTKAVDNIKVIKKNQTIELGQLKIYEDHAKQAKDKGEEMRKRQAKLERDMTTLADEVHKITDNLQVVEAKAKDAWDKYAQYEDIVRDLVSKKKDAQSKQSIIKDLKSDMGRELTEPDEDLQSTVDKYDETVKFYQQQKNTQGQRYNELSTELSRVRGTLDQKHAEHGRLEANQKHYEKKVKERADLVQELAHRHNIRGFLHDLDENQVRDFMDRISKLARDQQSTFEKAKRENQDELHNVQTQLNDLNGRKAALNQDKENAKKQLTVNDGKLAAQQEKLDQITFDEGNRAACEARVQGTESKLGDARTNFDNAGWDRQVKNVHAEIQSLEETANHLQEELIKSTAHASESAKLEYLKESLKESRHSLETMTGAHGESLATKFGAEWLPGNLDHLFQRKLDRVTADLKTAETNRDGSIRQLEQLDFKLSNSRTDAKSKKDDRKRLHSYLQEVLDADPSEYHEVRETLQKNRDIHISDIENSKNMAKFFKASLDYAQEHQGCRLCERSFEDPKERQRFELRLSKKMNQDIKEVEDDLKATEADLKNVEAAFSSHEAWVRLKDEIENADATTKQYNSSREQLVDKIEGHDRVVDQCQVAKREIESLSKTVQNITKYHTDIVKFENQMIELSGKQYQGGISRSHDEINEEIKNNNKEVISRRSTLNRLTADRDSAREKVNSLELALRDQKTQLNAAVQQLKEKSMIDTAIKELHDHSAVQRTAVTNAEKELKSAELEISKAQVQYDDIGRRGDETERHLREQASNTADSVNKLSSADRDIKTFIGDNGPQQLARSQRELDSLRQEIDKITQEQQNVTADAKKTEDALNDQERHKRRIADNLKYRREIRALRDLETEIVRLESQNAEGDRDKYHREANKYEAERQGLHAKQQHMNGQLKSMDGELERMLQDWDKEYKDAPERYRAAHINVETAKAAIDDLGRYSTALERAIMQYHSTKMEEINRIVDELWKTTYRGTDVDTILIKSDSEGATGAKSFKYRVSMVKQDVEMEMRGRCSAGQKVLASIIIRLALAECFGVSCGIIALDEPTTNLDRDNIASLGRSLANIIKSRQAQKNFQLVVITHDEQFLRDMNATEFCEVYYRITRDGRQKSSIERQRIGDIMN